MDDIEAAFAAIRPEDFFRATSARWTTKYNDLPATRRPRGVAGRSHFNDFVEGMLGISRSMSRHPTNHFHSFAIIHSPTEQRNFGIENDETVPDFARRLTRESHAMEGTWLFTAVMARGRSYIGEPQPAIDATNQDEIDQALEDGILLPAICWTAALREPGDSFDRGGMLYVDRLGSITSEVEGQLDPQINLFHTVLEG